MAEPARPFPDDTTAFVEAELPPRLAENDFDAPRPTARLLATIERSRNAG